MRTRTAMLALAATLLGCAHAAEESDGFPLTASMNARVEGDSVLLSLHVTNVSTEPVPLEFPSSQQYDFVVRQQDGPTVWSWSAARSFAQVLTVDTIAPGETRRYTAAWAHEGRTGAYVAEGRVLAEDRALALAIDLPLESPEP